MNFPEFQDEERDGGLRGVAVGIVTENRGDPEKMGRVKLKFPWKEEAPHESYWARIATLMAGSGRGTYFLPDIGDEVLVAFEDGDIHYPYVLGALWNGEEKPPEDNADKKNEVKKIRSRSGHEIVLNDSKTEGKVEVTTSGGHKVVLDDASGGKVNVEDKGGNSIELNSSQGSIKIAATGQLSIEAPKIDIKGDLMNIESSGLLNIKGAIIKLN